MLTQAAPARTFGAGGGLLAAQARTLAPASASCSRRARVRSTTGGDAVALRKPYDPNALVAALACCVA